MNKLYALSKYQLKLQLRSVKGLFFAIIFPSVMFLIFSNLLANSFNPNTKISITEYLVPAYIPIIVINTIIMTFGFLFITYKEHGYFIKYKLLGLKSFNVALSLFFTVFIFQLLGIGILIFMAKITKDICIPYNNIFSIIAAIVIINIFEFSLTYFLVSIIRNSGTYQAIAVILFYFQMFLGGLTFPPEVFSTTIRNLMEIINPIIYGLYILRGVWTEGNSIFCYGKECLILLALSLILILISKKTFKWQ